MICDEFLHFLKAQIYQIQSLKNGKNGSFRFSTFSNLLSRKIWMTENILHIVDKYTKALKKHILFNFGQNWPKLKVEKFDFKC